MRTRSWLGTVAVMAGIALPAPSAAADGGVACGDVLNRSVRLAADLTCSGTALTVAADGVQIDLNGHRLSAAVAKQGIGIRLEANAVIKNGTISGFADGIHADVAEVERPLDATVSQVALRGNAFGVWSSFAR